MPIKINFEGVESGFDPLPAGNYHVKVTDGEIRTAGENAKHPGSEMILWTLTVQTGEFENRKLFYNTTLLPHALFGLKGLLASTGRWEKAKLDSPEFDFEIDQVIGADVIAAVSRSTYQGEEVNNIRRIKPFDPTAVGAVAGSDLLP